MRNISIRPLILLIFFLFVNRPDAQAESKPLADAAEKYWQHELQEGPYLRLKHGLPVTRLPDLSYEHEKQEVAFAQSILKTLESIPVDGLTHEESLTYQILKWQNMKTVEGLPHFWFLSPITPYSSSIPVVHRVFAEYPLKTKTDPGGYFVLLKQYPAFLKTILAIVKEQYNRGIILPKEELTQVLAFLHSFDGPTAESIWSVKRERLAGYSDGEVKALQDSINQEVDSEIHPALKSLTDFLEGEYRQKAPDSVGLSQYPGGKEAYRFLVSYHTTMEVTPEQIHEIGLKQVEKINLEMQKIREELHFQGTKEEFHSTLKSDPKFYPKTAAEIGDTLMKYVHRIEPKVDAYFLRKPRAAYGVKRLDPALEGAMTFGYYQEPTKEDPTGDYYYNGSNLSERSLLAAAGLIYHELVPGHHFQLAMQSENESLPSFRREGGETAFVEGWGEYSSLLAGEMGMYQDPYERYGRLTLEAFLTSRLVVDTGMNELGWSRARAIQYMKDNTLLSDRELSTETLRYSTDIEGQALAYKMGCNKFVELREKARAALGNRFDIRKFHDTVLGGGSMPMAVLEQHIDWFIQQQKEATPSK